MAITDIPVKLDECFFISAGEDFQKGYEDGKETDEYRTSYDGDSYLVDVQISAFVEERGLKALTSQAVTLEVPAEGAVEALKKIRSLPSQTPVQFASLNVRTGVSKAGKAYSMWTGKGMGPVRPVAAVQARPAQS